MRAQAQLTDEFETRRVGGAASADRPFASTLSRWTQSRARRWFDIVLVLAVLPIAIPAGLIIAVAILATSPGPVLFVQVRRGLGGAPFSILKFRTIEHGHSVESESITRADCHAITTVGRFLRAWKLDELPQLLNVLRGDMSLVGPRPRVLGQPAGLLNCRPGLTGAASLAFAREEQLLVGVPRHQLDSYYANRVIPIKQRLDETYMARATFLSDVALLLKTGLRICMVGQPEPRDTLLAEDDAPIGAALPAETCD